MGVQPPQKRERGEVSKANWRGGGNEKAGADTPPSFRTKIVPLVIVGVTSANNGSSPDTPCG